MQHVLTRAAPPRRSSDLRFGPSQTALDQHRAALRTVAVAVDVRQRQAGNTLLKCVEVDRGLCGRRRRPLAVRGFQRIAGRQQRVDVAQLDAAGGCRSDEHTSELQSLMRSSYAVFCLKNTSQTDSHL